MNAHGQDIFIRQIFYDRASRAVLDPGFIPLDNAASPRPDWFEFHIIRDFLNAARLDEAAWYGFLSPRFAEKTTYSAAFVHDYIGRNGADADAVLFHSPLSWQDIAIFKSAYEQGELFHPGLTEASQTFFDFAGLDIHLHALVNHSRNAVYSNYIVARPKFWRIWLSLANLYYDYVERGSVADTALQRYRGFDCELKVFVQERFVCAILGREPSLRVVTPDVRFELKTPFDRTLAMMDLLKEHYCRSGDPNYLQMFYRLRRDMQFTSAGRPVTLHEPWEHPHAR